MIRGSGTLLDKNIFLQKRSEDALTKLFRSRSSRLLVCRRNVWHSIWKIMGHGVEVQEGVSGVVILVGRSRFTDDSGL
jgi:hypothetical protein